MLSNGATIVPVTYFTNIFFDANNVFLRFVFFFRKANLSLLSSSSIQLFLTKTTSGLFFSSSELYKKDHFPGPLFAAATNYSV